MPSGGHTHFVFALLLLGVSSGASQQTVPGPSSAGLSDSQTLAPTPSITPDIQQAIERTRRAQFADALPMWRALETEGNSSYTVVFNLALCELATGQYADAVSHLGPLESTHNNTAAVENLLAQAYLGLHQPQQAWNAAEAAARLTPTDTKLYAYLLDACADHYEFTLGLRIAELGLRSLPDSQRLHYEHATFLARLDRLDQARPEFARATALGPETDIGYLAQVQSLLYDNDLPHALTVARTAVSAGHRDYEMLSLLGTTLLYSGVSPGEPEFQDALTALESSVAQRPDYSTSQIALGKLYLMQGKAEPAIAHLEIGRRLEPQNPASYASLASAYTRTGNKSAANHCLQVLAGLLKEKSATSAQQP